jgi:hypothetical protein
MAHGGNKQETEIGEDRGYHWQGIELGRKGAMRSEGRLAGISLWSQVGCHAITWGLRLRLRSAVLSADSCVL